MDEFTVDAFVNRDEPVPVLSFDDAAKPTENEEDVEADLKSGKNKASQSRFSRQNIKDKVHRVTGKTTQAGPSIQDRLLEK